MMQFFYLLMIIDTSHWKSLLCNKIDDGRDLKVY